jgi:rSAM/selenodomain-associated transferase 2
LPFDGEWVVLISIIIPVLNEAAILDRMLRRLSPEAGGCEVILVDGGSIDETVALGRRHAAVITAARGRASQMNAGAKHASGDALLFLHADTALPDNAIEAIREALDDASVIGGRFRLKLDEQGWEYRMIGTAINLRDRLVKGFTGDQAIFVRTSAFRAMGGYHDIMLMEDLDFGRRMCRHGRVVRLPLYVTTSARRWRKKGLVRTILTMWSLKALYFLGCPPEKLNRLYGDPR